MKRGIRTIVSWVILAHLFMTPVLFGAGPRPDMKKNSGIKARAVLDAQTLDVNRIEGFFRNDGRFGENPASGGDGFYYPNSQRINSILFTSGLWILGKIGNDIRTAACEYSTEFQPGPILAGGTAGDSAAADHRIYKYNKGDTVDAAAIAQGCPAEVIGDQMLFCVFNDLRDHADVWQKIPIGIEVRMTAFAFNEPGAFENTIFIRYRIIHKGSEPLKDAYVAFFADPDLGQATDDYTGCDTVLNLAYVYNGDAYDGKYGAAVPALGFDILQGPLAPSPGDTAFLPDGMVHPNFKMLGMNAFFAYIGGSPISGMTDPALQDPAGAVMAYFFVSGLLANGDAWLDPENGNAPTRYPFSGDPVGNTGWTFSDLTRPGDVRMGLSAGPFDLDVNGSQEVVLGVVVGQGSDHLNSITVMKYYDMIIQKAFRNGFRETGLQALSVKAVQMDRDLMLVWEKAHEEAFASAGYAFEGYNVWQAEQAEGHWGKIMTFDRENGVTVIRDRMLNESTGSLDETVVQRGSDSGLRNDFRIERDYLGDKPLVNGRKYHLAVTAYGYDASEAPKILETPKAVVSAVPQAPVLDMEYHSEILDTLPVTLEGLTDGKVLVQVMDPAALTGHAYEVRFDSAQTGGKSIIWRLTDKTLNADLLSNQS